MGDRIKSILDGVEYQFLWFWLQVCRLFNPGSKVKFVELESSQIKGFDDVVVHFDQMTNRDGKLHLRDCYQIKYHRTGNGSLTFATLCDPKFINAKKNSFLQALNNAKKNEGDQFVNCTYELISPWQIHPDDVLAKIYELDDQKIDWSRLAKGSSARSEMGGLRKMMREHLDLADDEELRILLSVLRISQVFSIRDLREKLNLNLVLAGLRPINLSYGVDQYQELAKEFLKLKIHRLDRQKIEEFCKNKGLYEGPPLFSEDRKFLGVRTFFKFTDDLKARCDDVLDLTTYFENRKLVASKTWDDVVSAINCFVDKNAATGGKIDIEFHSILSVCFALGTVLPAQRRVDCAVIQPPRTRWYSFPPGLTADVLFQLSSVRENDFGEVAVSLSLTHKIHAEVAKFLSTSGKSEMTFIELTPVGGCGSTAITDGVHAWQLAQSFCSQLKQYLGTRDCTRVHLFSSAPASLLFFIGQLSRALPSITVYEYEFNSPNPTYFKGFEMLYPVV